MQITKATTFVIEDRSINVEQLNVSPGIAGQVLGLNAQGSLVFVDSSNEAQVKDIVGDMFTNGTHSNITTTYNSSTGTINLTAIGSVSSVNNKTGNVVLTTDDITEGTTNLYYTDARSRNSISVSDVGGDGNLVYDPVTGVFTYSGLEQSTVLSYFSGGTGVSLSNGVISIGQPVSQTSNVTFHNLTLDGDLTVLGTTTTINATELAIEDNLIYLNNGSTVTNPDLGWVGNYNDGTYAHAGMFRDSTDGRFKFFDSYVPEPGQNIDVAHATFNLATIQANTFIGNVTGTVSDISNHTTTNLTEGTNLYFTDTRVGTYLTNNGYQDGTTLSTTLNNLETDILSQVSTSDNNTLTAANQYTDSAILNVNSTISNLTTSDIAEGTNLYYTDSRSRNSISVSGDLSYNPVTGVISTQGLASSTTDDLAEGTTNLYYTDDRVTAWLAQFIVINDASEFGQLTYNEITGQIDHNGITSFEVRGLFNNGTGVLYDNTTGEFSIGQPVDTQANVEFKNMLLTGNLDVTGNFNVNGTVTYVNTTDLHISDNIIQLNSDVLPTQTPSQDSGIEINRGIENDVSIRWNEAIDKWQFTNDGIIYQNIGSLSASTTDELAEGTTNLYYTDARSTAAAQAVFDSDILNYTGTNLDLSQLTTDNLSEGTSNLYFTDIRARSAISTFGDLSYDPVTGVITYLERTDLEIRNLISATGDISYNNSTGVISFIERTDTEVRNLISVAGDLTYNAAQGIISYVERTDTEVRGLISVAGDLTYNAAQGIISYTTPTTVASLSNHTTTDLAEGTNLYYTDTRVDSRIDVLRTDLETSGAQDVHFNNLTNVPVVVVDTIVGTGSTSYALSSAPGSADALIVTIDGVTQTPGVDYTVSNLTLTFSTTLSVGYTAIVRHVGYQIVGGVASTNDLPLAGGVMNGSILVDNDNQYDLGSQTNQWRTIYGHEVEATYADLAERYQSDAPYEPGTVVVFGGEAEITTTVIELDVSVAGVISTNPALKLNSQAGNSQSRIHEITHPFILSGGRSWLLANQSSLLPLRGTSTSMRAGARWGCWNSGVGGNF